MTVPANPKIYHIVHVDRLPSIIASGGLWSDKEARQRQVAGTTIGMNKIKKRRLNELVLRSHPGLVRWRLCTVLLLPAIHNALGDP